MTATEGRCWPLWSRTTKQASNSSTDQGGGKRRAGILWTRPKAAVSKKPSESAGMRLLRGVSEAWSAITHYAPVRILWLNGWLLSLAPCAKSFSGKISRYATRSRRICARRYCRFRPNRSESARARCSGPNCLSLHLAQAKATMAHRRLRSCALVEHGVPAARRKSGICDLP